jgi:hypothetical protein
MHTLHNHLPMKMEQTQCSETSAIKNHTLENNPKDYTQLPGISLYSFQAVSCTTVLNISLVLLSFSNAYNSSKHWLCDKEVRLHEI